MSIRPWLAAAALLLAASITVGASAREAPARGAALQAVVTFDVDPPLIASAALLDRLLSPLAAEASRRSLARLGRVLAARPLDLARERFLLRAPAHAPADGYGLLVFVPASDRAELPTGWAAALDAAGMIFVSAARSGNDQDVLTRRAPLALAAAYGVAQRFKLDPSRVYVGGFSGGSRVAMRLALAYPDLFRGALLNAGADPIGVSPARPPARELFELFQARSRLVYLTGAEDQLHLGMDAGSQASLGRWCVLDYRATATPSTGHEVASGPAFGRALAALDRPARPDPDRLAACRGRLRRELDARVAQIASWIGSGRKDQARRALLDLDGTAGGLAMPELMELASRCDCRVFEP